MAEQGDSDRSVTTLGATAMAWRLVAVLGVLTILLVGTAWGQDSAFPVGPFRMFSTRDGPNSTIEVTEIEGVTAAGTRVLITGADTGLRRAEVEGQIKRFVAEPELMREVVEAYHDLFPERTLVRIEVVRREHLLRDGKDTGEVRVVVLASWEPEVPA